MSFFKRSCVFRLSEGHSKFSLNDLHRMLFHSFSVQALFLTILGRMFFAFVKPRNSKDEPFFFLIFNRQLWKRTNFQFYLYLFIFY